jgi:hypothetical protein
MKTISLVITCLVLVGCNSFNAYSPNYSTAVINNNTANVATTPTLVPVVLTTLVPTLPPVIKTIVVEKKQATQPVISSRPSNIYVCPKKPPIKLKVATPIPFDKFDELKVKHKNSPIEYQKAVIVLMTDHVSNMYGVLKANKDMVNLEELTYVDSCKRYNSKYLGK